MLFQNSFLDAGKIKVERFSLYNIYIFFYFQNYNVRKKKLCEEKTHPISTDYRRCLDVLQIFVEMTKTFFVEKLLRRNVVLTETCRQEPRKRKLAETEPESHLGEPDTKKIKKEKEEDKPEQPKHINSSRLSVNQKYGLQKQIEYYFSNENLPFDDYMLKTMEANGGCSYTISVFFKMIKKFLCHSEEFFFFFKYENNLCNGLLLNESHLERTKKGYVYVCVYRQYN
ncbi:hypothetical protein RFI_35864 [Reticulomyxa filosa]|uniref:HTH La-type RNA-binding domain-containing protein n=1 Tax=Reticulomyxa filosa TaxID=46433 RepID=X6LLH2_RETFI|nr:hypothetical protein RFI_35864 [Reticulomyxa filosa]|eukprot:ETO01580.1 hypothetical protein RFI_35864 [Reticulomyxa filosa]